MMRRKTKSALSATAMALLSASMFAVPASASEGDDRAADIFTVLDAANDVDGLDVPVRSGQNVKPVFGKGHACGKHNILCGQPMDAAVVVMEQGTKDPNRPPENPNWTANLYNKENPAETEDVIVGAFTGNVLAPLGPTPDGRPVGMITTFCNGKVRCPDWIAYAPFLPDASPDSGADARAGFGIVGDADYRQWERTRS